MLSSFTLTPGCPSPPASLALKAGLKFVPLLLLFVYPLLISCQDEGLFGLHEDRIKQYVDSNQIEPFMALSDGELLRTGDIGPSAWYYLALFLEGFSDRAPLPTSSLRSKAGAEGRSQEAPGKVSKQLPGTRGEGSSARGAADQDATALGLIQDLLPADTGELKPLQNRIHRLYQWTWQRAEGLLQRLALQKDFDFLLGLRAWKELLLLGQRGEIKLGPKARLEAASQPGISPAKLLWMLRRGQLLALANLGDKEKLSLEIARARKDFPEESREDADELGFLDALLSFQLKAVGREGLAKSILSSSLNKKLEARLALLDNLQLLDTIFSTEELGQLGLGYAFYKQDYTRALLALPLASDYFLNPQKVSPSKFSELLRSYLFSKQIQEGQQSLELFGAQLDRLRRHKVGGQAESLSESQRLNALHFMLAFYRGRFAAALNDRKAASLYLLASRLAQDEENRDAALWYYLDEKRNELLGARALRGRQDEFFRLLSTTASSWHQNRRFLDQVEQSLRLALRSGNFPLVIKIRDRFGNSFGSSFRDRLDYIVARLVGSKLVAASSLPAAKSVKAKMVFTRLAESHKTPLYYRALSAWHIGAQPDFLNRRLLDAGEQQRLAGASIPATQSDTSETASHTLLPKKTKATIVDADPNFTDPSPELQEIIKLIRISTQLGFGSEGYRLYQENVGLWSTNNVRGLSKEYLKLGRPDLSIRTAIDLTKRSDWNLVADDYKLLYPRPYNEEIEASLGPSTSLPIFFGLVRSESLFHNAAISRSGAVGLSQLMPSTAATVAKSLNMVTYELTNVKDNLTIGAWYFDAMLRQQGRPIYAMAAYNAGGGRLRQWLRSTVDLPDDLFVETIAFDETLGYCRNITEASLMYGLLYYEKNLDAMMHEIFEPKVKEATLKN